MGWNFKIQSNDTATNNISDKRHMAVCGVQGEQQREMEGLLDSVRHLTRWDHNTYSNRDSPFSHSMNNLLLAFLRYRTVPPTMYTHSYF